MTHELAIGVDKEVQEFGHFRAQYDLRLAAPESAGFGDERKGTNDHFAGIRVTGAFQARFSFS